MKKILLSWYGITDLKASFKLDENNGPIFNAIKQRKYDKAIILGYVDKDKKIDEFFSDFQGLDIVEIIKKYSNTLYANKNFKLWLQEKLLKENAEAEIVVYDVFLDSLSDTYTMYKAIDDVLKELSDRECIEIFLSPGTPVMAFMWACTSFLYPKLNIKFIASSSLTHEIEEIKLPRLENLK